MPSACLQGANQQKYLLLVNMVQKKSIDSLVEELKRGKYLSKARVVQESKPTQAFWPAAPLTCPSDEPSQ